VKKALGHTGSLFRSGIITEINLNSHSSFYDLSDSIVEYLAGICDRKLVLQFLRSDEEETYDLASFTSIHPARIALIRDILASSNPSNILLYGKAGTGKTEFARALVAAVGKQISFLEYGRCNYSFSQAVDPSRRMVALCGAVNAVSPLNGVIIVDEADNLLNTMNLFLSAKDSVEKGQLNGFIDNPKAHIIWIANDVRWVEESTMRRFSYSLYFREYSSREREIIWHNVLKGHPLKKFVTAKMIKEMSDDFNVNAGGVAKAIRAAESILASRRPTRGVVRSLLREILERHEELIHGSFREHKMKPLHSLTEQYDVSALNTDMDPGLVRKAVVSFASRIQKNAFPENRNMNLLFWGQAGTGKTEFAKFLARESGLKLIVKRYSDLESKWVGETEKNIAGAFREAEAEQAILFVDEAD
jgi:SpoVK/Ycf46/Vps4 family AAA+-type ATPase